MPTATPTQTPADTPNPGPNAASGHILLNGQPGAGIKIQLFKSDGSASYSVTTDSQGFFTVTNLTPGGYYAYYYNDSDRQKIGYWRSRTLQVDATNGAAFPPIDFYQVGMTNVPAMDAHVSLPYTFQWVPQTQTVQYYIFEVHSAPGKSFSSTYMSARLPGDATSFTWDGSGANGTLDPTNRYFWGVYWNAGPAGEGGNLYQAVYFNSP